MNCKKRTGGWKSLSVPADEINLVTQRMLKMLILTVIAISIVMLGFAGYARLGRTPIRSAEMLEIHQKNVSLIAELQLQQFMLSVRSPRGVTLTFDTEFTFDSSKSSIELTANFKIFLDRLVRIINSPGSTLPIEVVGHTDNLPMSVERHKKYPTNYEFSGATAGSVVRYLHSKGVRKSRLQVVGYGASVPYGTSWISYFAGVSEEDVIIANITPEHQAMNRRLEITFRSVR